MWVKYQTAQWETLSILLTDNSQNNSSLWRGMQLKVLEIGPSWSKCCRKKSSKLSQINKKSYWGTCKTKVYQEDFSKEWEVDDGEWHAYFKHCLM